MYINIVNCNILNIERKPKKEKKRKINQDGKNSYVSVLYSFLLLLIIFNQENRKYVHMYCIDVFYTVIYGQTKKPKYKCKETENVLI